MKHKYYKMLGVFFLCGTAFYSISHGSTSNRSMYSHTSALTDASLVEGWESVPESHKKLITEDHSALDHAPEVFPNLLNIVATHFPSANTTTLISYIGSATDDTVRGWVEEAAAAHGTIEAERNVSEMSHDSGSSYAFADSSEQWESLDDTLSRKIRAVVGNRVVECFMPTFFKTLLEVVQESMYDSMLGLAMSRVELVEKIEESRLVEYINIAIKKTIPLSPVQEENGTETPSTVERGATEQGAQGSSTGLEVVHFPSLEGTGTTAGAPAPQAALPPQTPGGSGGEHIPPVSATQETAAQTAAGQTAAPQPAPAGLDGVTPAGPVETKGGSCCSVQ